MESEIANLKNVQYTIVELKHSITDKCCFVYCIMKALVEIKASTCIWKTN